LSCITGKKIFYTQRATYCRNRGKYSQRASFSQIKMIRETDGKENITDYSVKYEDQYVFQNDRWLIKERTGYFIIVETREFA
jgi:hypothetical protein